MDRRNRWLLFLGFTGLLLVAVTLGLVGGLLLGRRTFSDGSPPGDVPAGAEDEFELMAEAWDVIEQNYVNQEGVEPRRMAHSAISGMVQTLGDVGHTRFLTPEMAERHRQQLQGEVEGIGAYVEMEDGEIVIVAPIDGSPADRAGLESGDVIVGVDGDDVTGFTLDQVVSRVTGPAGTEVTITVRDGGTGNTRQVTLERERIELDLVTWTQLPGKDVAYVRISAFSNGATDDLEQTLQEIEQEGVGSLILDLRNNPGGLLSEAIGVTSHFVEDGDVLLRRGAEGETRAESVNDVDAIELPMVTLVNGGTASAAEIVTGALQDHERGTVVGTTTVGAGTVLSSFSLSDDSLLLLATEEWLTPDGRVIWKKGLDPDIEVTLAPDVEPLIRLSGEDITEEELENSGDEQLLRALEILESGETQ